MKIQINKKTATLRFGMLCWEKFQSLAMQSVDGKVKSLSNLVVSAIGNEEEITGPQGFEDKEILEWVDNAFTTEKGSRDLEKIEKAFMETYMYKNFLKSISEDKKKVIAEKAPSTPVEGSY